MRVVSLLLLYDQLGSGRVKPLAVLFPLNITTYRPAKEQAVE